MGPHPYHLHRAVPRASKDWSHRVSSVGTSQTPISKMVNAHTRCDYHVGNPGHSIKNCTALKWKVQNLINDGKLNFEDLDRPSEVKGPSRINVEMTRQEKETPKEANFEKAALPKEKVPIAKVRKSEASSSSTTEGSKEWLGEPNREEEKRCSKIWSGT